MAAATLPAPKKAGLPAAFQSLLALGLITHAQHSQAAAHKELHALECEAEALLWMMVHGIASETELQPQADRLRGEGAEHDPREREKLQLLDEALEMADQLACRIVREPLDRLLALGLIDAAQHSAGCEVRPVSAEGHAATPAGALAVLKNRGIVSAGQFQALKAQASAVPPSAGVDDALRQRIVLEAEAVHARIVDQYADALWTGVRRLLVGMLLSMTVVSALVFWWTAA